MAFRNGLQYLKALVVLLKNSKVDLSFSFTQQLSHRRVYDDRASHLDNSIKSVRLTSGFSFFAERKVSESQRNGLMIKQTGTPTHLSIARIVETFILKLTVDPVHAAKVAQFNFATTTLYLSFVQFIFDGMIASSSIKKIVIIGPESTGKSTLCAELADHYQTSWCPEYARGFLLTHGMNYTYDDLLTIAKGQLDLEDRFTKGLQEQNNSDNLLFIDTDMYVMKVWCDFVFGKCHPFIIEQIRERKYDHYLLCNTDLPWVKDELREYPDIEQRQKLFLLYKSLLSDQSVPWTEISGNYAQRLNIAIAAVEELKGNK